MDRIALLLLLVAGCSHTSSLTPRGICLNKTMTRDGQVQEGALLRTTHEECVEEMNRYCSNSAKAKGEVFCSLYWRIGGPAATQTQGEAEPREPGEYDDV